MSLYLKATRSGRRATHADGFVWPEHGEWFQVSPGPLVACRHGIHVCRPDQIMAWLSDELHVIETDDRFKQIEMSDKVVVRRARLVRQLPWDERSARLFAAECAERVLPIFERERLGDGRPRLAISAARAFACGEIYAAARDAAGAAAGAAAWAAAWDAAGAAERAWQGARLIEAMGIVEMQP